jgi:hypothetical protein
MIEYVYIVKCPNCEDEHFYFFDEAKACAMGYISDKPIITQVEVERNDFGECTDSHDLGTIWSWEETMKDTEDRCTDTEPTKSMFTKDDLKDHAPEEDAEFASIDNSVDFEPETSEISDDSRKPIPEGMSLRELVEAMEENEDTVECAGCEELFSKDECFYKDDIGWLCPDCEDTIVKCTWCDELFDKSECRYEVNLGWLCDRCQAAIMSRGETLTFKEGSYWDFLDEKLDIDFSEIADSSDMEIWGIESMDENTYKATLMKNYENVDLQDGDATQSIHDEMLKLGGLFVFYFNKAGVPVLLSWNSKLLNNLGSCEIIFEDEKYDQACEQTLSEAFNKLNEELSSTDLVKDSINHLVNDLGKDPWADGFADEVIADIEKNYEVEVPEGLAKYNSWANSIAAEVSRQVNKDYKLEEEVSKEFVDKLESSEEYRARLEDCPECGSEKSFDSKTGFCLNCGFN